MKLAELKEEVRLTWESVEDDGSGIVPQPENFLPEIRKYGDLRRKATWEKAYFSLYATCFHEELLDASFLVTHVFNFTQDKVGYEYRHELFEAFLVYPDGLELIEMGLKQVNLYPENNQESIDGFQRLVQEQCERGNGLTAGFAGQFPALARKAAG